MLRVYSIKDEVAEEFSAPQLAKTDGVAVRMFQQAISKAPYPQDYSLWRIGSFDTETGLIISEQIQKVDLTEISSSDEA